jgi:hypothetical protein
MTVNVFLLVDFFSKSLSDVEVALVRPSEEGTGVTLPFRLLRDVPLTGAVAELVESPNPDAKIFPRPILSRLDFPRL